LIWSLAFPVSYPIKTTYWIGRYPARKSAIRTLYAKCIFAFEIMKSEKTNKQNLMIREEMRTSHTEVSGLAFGRLHHVGRCITSGQLFMYNSPKFVRILSHMYVSNEVLRV
jgi:hypothetical protein